MLTKVSMDDEKKDTLTLCCVLITVLLAIIATIALCISLAEITPGPSAPYIVKQAWTAEVSFQVATREGESQSSFPIECEAEGNPAPVYRWIKDGQDFIWQDHEDRISQQAGEGTLIFVSPRDEDAGEYQCYALNEYGSAISRPVHVRKLGSDMSEPTIDHIINDLK